MDLSIVQMLAAGLIALFVGLLTGIFGVGGGFLMTPALIILVAIPGPVAVGTGLVNFFANSTLGIIKRYGSGTIAPKIAFLVGLGSMVGVMIGSWMLEFLNKLPDVMIQGRSQSLLEIVLMCVFFLLLSGIAVFMIWDVRYAARLRSEDEYQVGLLARIKLPPYGHFPVLDEPRMSIAALFLFGVLGGILTGLLGIGGGVIMLPALIYLVGLHTHKAAGTSLLLVWIASLAGAVNNLLIGNVDWILLAILLAGGMLGTWVGTHIAMVISGKNTRQYFIYVLVLAILLVAGRLFVMLLR
ncbi:MAG: sulfite exporter TauE/SafE family protein [Kiritimatiellia bacterium]